MKRSLYALARAACRHLPVIGAILAENQALQAAIAASAGVQAGLLADAGRHRQHAAALPPDFDIIIPVCNAAPWLNVIADAYDTLRITPLYIVDERSADASLDILQRRKARILRTTGAKPYAESMLIGVLPALSASWVLRLDDDELPSTGLLDFIRQGLAETRASMVGLPRHWVMQNGTEWRRTRAAEGKGYFGADYQYRLFQPAKVQVVPHLHSPGYLVKHAVAAPPSAAFPLWPHSASGSWQPGPKTSPA